MYKCCQTIHFITVGNCSELLPPLNGSIAYSINDTFVIAEHSCKTVFSLHDGDVERFCDEAGVWTGTKPICVDDGMSTV